MRAAIPALLLALPVAAATATLDGRKINYVDTGKGEPALVLIHGWTCDRTFWSANIEAFKTYHRVLALDLPGHGQSETAPDYSMGRFARAVDAVMRDAGVGKAVLVGHSMGGAVMLSFLRQFPDKVLGIVAVDAMFIDTATAEKMSASPRNFAGPDGQQAREKMIRSMFSPVTTPALQEKILKGMLAPTPETATRAMSSLWDPEVWKPGQSDLPVLAVMAPSRSAAMTTGTRARFPQARVVTMEGTGHFLMMEKPAEFNAVVLDWVRTLAPKTADASPRRSRVLPAHVASKLFPADRELFGKLMQVGLEAAWVATTEEGYPQCFINELTPLNSDRRMVGRARTIRYLPNRKDLREKLYAAGPQLNYRSSEEAEPGDVLVYDAGGETRATVTGFMTTTRLIAKGGSGVVVDGCMRDIPDLAASPAGVFVRCGHASTVGPILMSADYQVPVRIGGVTVIPGDLLIGERHGILVIPASIVDKVLAKAITHDLQEEFQRKMLQEGQSIYGLYPTLNEENRRKFEAYKKQRD